MGNWRSRPLLMEKLPDELILYIFSQLLEADLIHISIVSRRFNHIANDTSLWKHLYQSVFEYSIPLSHPRLGEFKFGDGASWTTGNCWKESFKQLAYGVHVRLDLSHSNQCCRKFKHFKDLKSAIQFLETEKPEKKLIFLHPGIHANQNLHISQPIQIIGAATGPVNDIKDKVSLVGNPRAQIPGEGMEPRTEPVVDFDLGADSAFLGYITVILPPYKRSRCFRCGRRRLDPVAVLIDNSSPILQNCHISCPIGDGLVISGPQGAPRVQFCFISNCDRGIVSCAQAKGLVHGCVIAHNKAFGILACSDSIFKNNTIHDNIAEGVYIVDGSATFYKNELYGNDHAVGLSFFIKGPPMLDENHFWGTAEEDIRFIGSLKEDILENIRNRNVFKKPNQAKTGFL